MIAADVARAFIALGFSTRASRSLIAYVCIALPSLRFFEAAKNAVPITVNAIACRQRADVLCASADVPEQHSVVGPQRMGYKAARD